MYKINKSELFESLIEQNLFGEPFMLDLFGQTPDYEFDRDTKMDTDMSRDPYLKSQILVNINEVDKDSIKKIENDPNYFEKMIKAWAKKYDADWYYSTFYTDMEGNNVMIVFDEPTEDDVWQAEKYLAADGKKLKDIAVGDIVEVTNEKDAFYGCKGKVEDFFGKNNAQVFITYCPSNENVGNTEMILIKNLSKDKSSMMANGGGVMEMENGGELTDGELDMLNDYGFRIKELQDFLNKKFPDSFQFRVFYPKGRAAELIPDYDRKIGGGLYGIQDENLKLMFPTDRRSARSRSRGLIYRTYQGGENTYFDFVIIDKDYNEYIGTFGFKDDGDVDKEYITRFIAFLHEAYGYPFSVKHIVAKDGTTIAGLKIPNISVQAPKKIEKDSWDVSSKAIKKITMYKVEIVGGEGTLYFDNEKDAEKWYNKIKNFKNMSELYDVYFEEVENMFKKDQPSFKGYKQSPYKSYEIGSIMPFSAFQKIKPKTHLVLTYKNAGVDRKIDFIFDKIALDKAIGWLKFDDEWKYGDYIYDYEGNASFGSGASRLTLEKIVAKDGTTIAQKNKIAEVMHEFKVGKLKDRSGKVITNRKQAIAIALSASRKYNDGGYVTYDAISVATDEIDEMSDMEVADYLGIDVSEMNNEYRYDAIYKKAEEIMSESQYADGGFFGFGKSQYNTGRSWHLDRARYNKREKWEKPRAADGKKIDKRSSWHSDRRQYNKNEKWEKPLSKRKEVKIKVSLYNYGEFLRDEEIDLIDLPIRQLNSYELEGFNIREKDEDKYFYADDFYIDTDAEGTAIKYAYATKTKYAALGSKIGEGYNDKYMALSNCDIIHEYATKLDEMVSEDTELEEWVKMKMTRVEQNIAGVKHALEALSKYDDGGEIFKKQLLHIAKYAVEIKNLINGGTELMSWMEAKLAISAEYIDGVYHHLDYEMGNRAKNVGMPNEYAKNGKKIAEKIDFDKFKETMPHFSVGKINYFPSASGDYYSYRSEGDIYDIDLKEAYELYSSGKAYTFDVEYIFVADAWDGFLNNKIPSKETYVDWKSASMAYKKYLEQSNYNQGEWQIGLYKCEDGNKCEIYVEDNVQKVRGATKVHEFDYNNATISDVIISGVDKFEIVYEDEWEEGYANGGGIMRAKEEYAEDGIEIADDGFGILYSRNGKTYIITADTEDQVELIEMALNDYRDGLIDREELENTLQSYMNDEQEVDLYDIIDIGGKPYIYDDFYGGQIELKSNEPINIDESTEIEFANGGGVDEKDEYEVKVEFSPNYYYTPDSHYYDRWVIKYRKKNKLFSFWKNYGGFYSSKYKNYGGFYSSKSQAEEIATSLSKNNDKLLKEILKEEELEKNNKLNYRQTSYYANGGGVGEQYSVWEIPTSGKPIKLYTGSMVGAKKFANKHKMSLKSGHGLETWPADTTEQEVARYSNSMTATSQQYANGGGVKKRSLMSVAHLVVADWRKESIRDWYMKNYPTDDLGEELNDATFTDLWDGLNNKTDIYEIMGVGDSVVRERLFEHLALIYGVDYDVVYKKWVGYANGGDISARGKIIVTKISDIPNLMQELNAGRVTYRGLGMGKLYNDFYEIANESGTRIKVKGKEYYITDTDFRKLNWDDKKKEWKNLIRFSAPQRRENGGGTMAKRGTKTKGGFMVFNYTDNIYASPDTFKTEKEANDFIKQFRKRFESQGYYRDNRMRQIAIEDIDLLAIPEDFNPFNPKSQSFEYKQKQASRENGGGVSGEYVINIIHPDGKKDTMFNASGKLKVFKDKKSAEDQMKKDQIYLKGYTLMVVPKGQEYRKADEKKK